MYRYFRPLLFKLDPEDAHQLTLRLIRLGGFAPIGSLLRGLYAAPARPMEAFGLHFRNPVGLAAGYDKDGLAWRGLSTLGFGHIEVGTVTPLPQPGNPRPRIFRLVEDQAVINRMGFPGQGAEAVMRTLRRSSQRLGLNLLTGLHVSIRAQRPGGVILGVNIGKNKQTPNEEAVFDYLALLQNFAPLADYLAINVSSPNTVGLRRLQERTALEGLLMQLDSQRKLEEKKLERHLPLLVKLAPDLTVAELDDAIEAILRTGMDGVIVTNTTLAREGLQSSQQREEGGLSGRPLAARARQVVQRLHAFSEGRLPIIGCGGITTPDDARAMLDAGATLLQIYTGFIYEGPGIARRLARGLV